MNPITGELLSLVAGLARAPQGFHRLPKRLDDAATAALGNRQSAFVNIAAPGSLQDWARKKRKAIARKKMAKASKKRNRQP